VGVQQDCQFSRLGDPRAKRSSADTDSLCRGRVGTRCSGIHFKGTTASGVFLPDTTQPALVRRQGFKRTYGLFQPSETKTVISSSKGAVSAGFHIEFTLNNGYGL
jgi:hypothetical protein